jgi:hypothetical protein
MAEATQFLYRYRHLQGEHREYTSRILTDSLIYFPPPTSFNDPFDCKVHFQPSNSKPEVRKLFGKLIRENRPDLNREQRRRLRELGVRHVGHNPSLEEITCGIQDDIDKLGVLSLSASDNNILLWSHYAASHSGICLQFLAEDNTLFFGRAQKVQYLTEYPRVHLHDDPELHVKSFLLSKAYDWSYEQEWRIIDENGPGEKKFPEDLLIGVILGVHMSTKDKNFIINLLRKRKHQVRIYQAIISKGSFSLEIKALDP